MHVAKIACGTCHTIKRWIKDRALDKCRCDLETEESERAFEMLKQKVETKKVWSFKNLIKIKGRDES